jgi:hypothetical protein
VGGERQVPGFVAACTLFENDNDAAWIFAVFDDRVSYDKSADDPEQDKQYRQFRTLMEDEPEWHDGQIEGM